MMIDNKKEKEVLLGYKNFVRVNGRIPSIRELASSIGWKKSITDKYIQRLVIKGIMMYEQGVGGRSVYKSLKLVEGSKK